MWNNERYLEVKTKCRTDIERGIKKPYDYMMIYKEMIEEEDYEAAKGITEVLRVMNYDTKDTHDHIKSLNTNRTRPVN